MFREFEESDVFFTDTVEDADGSGFFVGEANNFPAGATEVALERDDARGRGVEVVLEELF